MKRLTKQFFFLLMGLFALLVAGSMFAQNARVTGVFSNLEINGESGDVLGIEVIISGTFSGKYYATFQSSEGEPRRPVVANVTVKGNKVEFFVDEESGYKGVFQGVVDGAGLKGRFLNGQLSPQGDDVFDLKRKPSFWM